MKTLKSVLVAAIVALTMVSLSYAEGFKEKPKFRVVTNLNIEQAIKNPGLVRTMYQQISWQEVVGAHQHVYIGEVVFLGKTYRITGTLDQWKDFFLMDGMPRANCQRGKNVS
jgi:hypothetical protein